MTTSRLSSGEAPSFVAVLHGPDHVFTWANDAYFELTGRQKDIIGKALLDAIPELKGQGFKELLDGVLNRCALARFR